MRKISGNVVWTKPISLPRAAKLLSRFSAVDNGSSGPVSLYLQRASEAFDHLVQFHNKRGKMNDLEQKPNSPRVAEAIDSKTGGDKKPRAIDDAAEVEKMALKNEEQKKESKKKKKKRRSAEVDSNNKRDRKKRRTEDVDL